MATGLNDLGGDGATAPDAPAAKPAKKRRAPKKKADGAPSKRSKANATYTDMITMAIQALNNRKGSSTPAITAWIGEQYPKLKVKKTTVGAKIRPLVDSGYLIRVKSSFLLSSATKDALRKAKAAAKKADGGGGGGGGGGGARRRSPRRIAEWQPTYACASTSACCRSSPITRILTT